MSGGAAIILVSHGELRRFIIDALVAGGAGDADAAVVAEGSSGPICVALTATAFRGCRAICGFIARGEIDPKAQPRVFA